MTITPDIINGSFEIVGGCFTWVNAWHLYQAKRTQGVYWPTWLFFTVWGAWNLIYYPMLGQWFSFIAGIWLVSGNAAWVVLAIYYNRKNKAQLSEL